MSYYLSATPTIARRQQPIFSEDVPIKIYPGSSVEIPVDVPVPAQTALGKYYILARVNSGQSVVESEYTNNDVASRKVTFVSSKPLNKVQRRLYDTAIATAKRGGQPRVVFSDAAAVALIAHHEGFVPFPYLDSKGYATIGYGTLISVHRGDVKALGLGAKTLMAEAVTNGQVRWSKGAKGYVLTSGNAPVDATAITEVQARQLMNSSELAAKQDVIRLLGQSKFSALGGNGQIVLIDMSYNLGPAKLPEFTGVFRFLGAVPLGFLEAGYEMFRSDWAVQVTHRLTGDSIGNYYGDYGILIAGLESEL